MIQYGVPQTTCFKNHLLVVKCLKYSLPTLIPSPSCASHSRDPLETFWSSQLMKMGMLFGKGMAHTIWRMRSSKTHAHGTPDLLQIVCLFLQDLGKTRRFLKDHEDGMDDLGKEWEAQLKECHEEVKANGVWHFSVAALLG